MANHRLLEEALDTYYLEEPVWKRGRNVIAALALLGWGACAAGVLTQPGRFAFSYLVAFVFFATLLIGSLFFVMLQHVTGAAWSVTMRRFAENIMITVPWLALLFVPVALLLRHLYPWTDAALVAKTPELLSKRTFLNEPWFIGRTLLYVALLSFWAMKLYRSSVAQDGATSLARTRSAERWSAPGLVMLAFTTWYAATDWIMSLEPEWYSSIFGIYVYAGAAVSFIALLILVLMAFRRADALRYSVHQEHYHDLGKWLFGLTIFWAYIGFSHYLLIWYANMPEETSWFRIRSAGGWGAVALVLVIGNFFAPFLLLISRPAKRKLKLLGAVAGWLLLMHYLDVYWMTMPEWSKSGPAFNWLDAASVLAVGGSLALPFWARLRRHALAPVGDLRFERSLEFRNV